MTQTRQVSSVQIWLDNFVLRHGAASGTVHFHTSDGLLTLAASVAIPPPVLQVIQTIPKGKGMAGLAWQRDEPVSTCNLKTDTSGDVRPGAKAVAAQAAVAMPIHDQDRISGVVGIAFADEKLLTPEEVAALNAEAEGVPRPPSA